MIQGERETSLLAKRQEYQASSFSQAEFTSFAEGFILGTNIDWSKISTIDASIGEKPENRQLLKLHDTLLSPPTPESEKVLKTLADDLKKFTPSAELIISKRFTDFWFKLDFAMYMAVDFGYLGKDEIGKEEKRYMQIADSQFSNLTDAVEKLKPGELSALWRVQNFMQRYDVFDPISTSLGAKTDLDKYSKLTAAVFRAKERLTVGRDWEWQDVNAAIDALTWVDGRYLNLEITTWLFTQLKISKKLQPESLQLVNLEDFNFNPDGLIKLLEYHPAQKEREILEPVMANDEIPYMHVPQLIILYWCAAGRMPKDVLKSQLQYLKEQTDRQKGLTANFVAFVIAICEKGVISADEANGLVGNLKNLADNFKGILTDQKPGRIFITPQRRLRIPGGSLRDGVLLYESTAPEIAQDPQVSNSHEILLKPKEAEVDENLKDPDSVLTYDFIGDVAIAKNQDIEAYLNELRVNNLFFEDDLLSRLDDAQKSYKELDSETTLIFTADLNSEDPAIKSAKRLGIETIVISGPVVTFVLNKDTIYAQTEDGRVPLAITGVLSEDGWLELDASEDSIIDEHSVLALSLIALELLNRQGAISQKTDTDRQNTLREQARNWNRSKKSNFGRISPTPDSSSPVQIAISIGGKTLFTSESV